MKSKVRELWNLCFDDEESFTELYFDKRYSEDINVCILQDDEVISALQMLPYPMTFHQHVIPTAYISGACTHPAHRKKGVMKQLLSKSFTQMEDRGVLLTTLIPANDDLFHYYASVGYTPAFDYAERLFSAKTPADSCGISIKEVQSFDEDFYCFFESKMSERNCCIQHPKEDLDVILAAIQLDKGGVWAAYKDERLTAIAFSYIDKETLRVMELLTSDKKNELFILQLIAQQSNAKSIAYKTTPAEGESQKLGMARVINAEKLLSLYAQSYPNIQLEFNLVDEMVDNNNGTYCISKGKVEKRRIEGVSLQLTINELTQAVMGYQTKSLPDVLHQCTMQSPFMSLMLD